MSQTFEHVVLEVPDTLEGVVDLLTQKYAEGWTLNSIQLVKMSVEQPEAPHE